MRRLTRYVEVVGNLGLHETVTVCLEEFPDVRPLRLFVVVLDRECSDPVSAERKRLEDFVLGPLRVQAHEVDERRSLRPVEHVFDRGRDKSNRGRLLCVILPAIEILVYPAGKARCAKLNRLALLAAQHLFEQQALPALPVRGERLDGNSAPAQILQRLAVREALAVTGSDVEEIAILDARKHDSGDPLVLSELAVELRPAERLLQLERDRGGQRPVKTGVPVDEPASQRGQENPEDHDQDAGGQDVAFLQDGSLLNSRKDAGRSRGSQALALPLSGPHPAHLHQNRDRIRLGTSRPESLHSR